jgi:hypothetical protein
MHRKLQSEAVPYMQSLNRLTDEQAAPWVDHRCFGGREPMIAGAGPDFHRLYGST